MLLVTLGLFVMRRFPTGGGNLPSMNHSRGALLVGPAELARHCAHTTLLETRRSSSACRVRVRRPRRESIA